MQETGYPENPRVQPVHPGTGPENTETYRRRACVRKPYHTEEKEECLKTLVITEKPSVARTIAAALGGARKKEGYLEGEEYIFSWCLGHLVGLADCSDYDERYAKWKMEDLPLLPEKWQYKLLSDKKAQFGILKKLMKRRDVRTVVNACDAGREGELIFRLVYLMAGCRKEMRRLWISSMEAEAVRKGMANLQPGSDYDSLFAAALARHQADWAVGINATRLFSLRCSAQLSVGRVITPTLCLAAERQNAIDTFVPQRYWKISLLLKGVKAVSGRIETKREAEKLAAACESGTATVSEVVQNNRKQNPPALFDLTTLQREANRLFGFTAQRTLELAQKLYEQRLLTYPRTDSHFLPDDMGETAEEIIRGIRKKYAFFSGGGENIARGLNSKKVSDHYAIIPTLECVRRNIRYLEEDERRLLVLVAARLMCATGRPRLYKSASITVTCAQTEFRMRGIQPVDDGWKADERAVARALKADPDTPEEETEEEEIPLQELPAFALQEKFRHPSAEISEHLTAPPAPYTEASLLCAMEHAGTKEITEDTERRGLGTPATRASMIERLLKTHMLERKGKKLIPTATGMAAVKALPAEITSPSMTAEWENRLARIAAGHESPQVFMEDIRRYVRDVVETYNTPAPSEVQALFRRQDKTEKTVGQCPRCGCDVTANAAGWGCTNWNCRFMLYKDSKFFERKKKKLTVKIVRDLLKNGRSFVRKLYSERSGNTYDAYVALQDTGKGPAKYTLEFDTESGKKISVKQKKRSSGQGKTRN